MEFTCHYADGKPEMKHDWYCGRMLGLRPNTCEIDRPVKDGEIIELHIGYGALQKYRVSGKQLIAV